MPSDAPAPGRPTGGVAVLRLVPEEVVPAGRDQLGLWGPGGSPGEEPGVGDDVREELAERAGRAMARVQGLLGQPAVVTAVPVGGRGPGGRVRYVPWGDSRSAARAAPAPWPGRIPAPNPAYVPVSPLPAEVVDAAGTVVTVSPRYAVSAPPARLAVAGGPPRPVTAWAGPWPVEERWWDAAAAREAVRFQVATADGAGWLLALADGRWWVEAVYD